ncbi:MAG: tetratricopeptide repeat protein [Candidatus Kariarchaeaceae archaeon]
MYHVDHIPSEILDYIDQLIKKGSYNDARNQLQSLDEQYDIERKTFESRILRKQSQFKSALDLAREALEMSKEGTDTFKQLSAMLAVAKSHWGLGELDQSLEMINKAMKNYETMERTESLLLVISDFLNLKGLVLYDKGEFGTAFALCEEGLQIRRQVGDDYGIGKSLNSIGVIYANQGELNKSLDYFQRSLTIKEKIGNKQEIAYALNNIASINFYQGNYSDSIEMNKKVLSINEDLGNTLDMASTLNNIGVDYHTTGELDLALEHYQRGLGLYKEIGNKQSIAMCISNIGGIYEHKSMYSKALENYELSLNIRKEIGNELEIADSLFSLVSLSMEMKKEDKAREYMQQLERIKQGNSNKLIALSYNLSKALILKKQTRARDKLEAHQIFNQIIEDEILDYQQTIFAMFNLCELLIEELKSYGSEEVIEEIKGITDKLLEVAKEQNSFSILAETYLLQSKLELLIGDLTLAKRLINQAFFTAEEKGLIQLAMKISEDYDALLDRLDLWESLIEQDASISERLEQLNLQDQMMRLIQKKWSATVIAPEEPINLMLLSIGGLVLYSKSFAPGEEINEHLIGSFISAINSFSSEAFATRGSIERIKHQEYSIAMKRKEKITFCYAFKGQLFPAKQTLNKVFERVVKDEEVWNELIGLTPLLPIATQQQIDSVVADVFR